MLKVSRTAADAETEKEPELVVHVDEFLFAADMPMLMSMMMGMMMMMMGPCWLLMMAAMSPDNDVLAERERVSFWARVNYFSD